MPKKLNPVLGENISDTLKTLFAPDGEAYRYLFSEVGQFDVEEPFTKLDADIMRAEGCSEESIEAERRKYDDHTLIAPLVHKRLKHVLSVTRDELFTRLNPDICSTERQATDFGNDVIDVMETELTTPIEIPNGDFTTRLPRRVWPYTKNTEFTLEDLIARMQVTRLECAHCLNDTCKFRDPEVPPPELTLEDGESER